MPTFYISHLVPDSDREELANQLRIKYIQGFHQVWYQDGVKATVSRVVEDLEFKISEGLDKNWCFPDCAQLAVSAKLRQLTGQSQENTNFGPNLLKYKIWNLVYQENS